MEFKNFIDCEKSIEIEQGFTEVEKQGRIWTYKLQTKSLDAIFNITVLFRGDDDEILSHLQYGLLLANGICIDTLREAEYGNDKRVQEFKNFSRDNPLPSSFKCEFSIVLVFRDDHEYGLDKIRIIADSILKQEALPSSIVYNYFSHLGSIEICNGEMKVFGTQWTHDFAGAILDEEVEILIKSDDDESPKSRDVEMAEESVTTRSLNDYLNYIVEWRAQRALLRKSLSKCALKKE